MNSFYPDNIMPNRESQPYDGILTDLERFWKEFQGIETELGTNVAGLATDLKTRLLNGLAINVKDYGAVGLDLDDETTAFTNALAAAAGKQLYIPNGIYRISADLTIPANTTIFGEGMESTIVKQITPATRGFRAYGNNIRLSNFTLRGHAGVVTSMSKTAAIAVGEYTVGSNAISGGNYSNLTVDHMIIKRWGSIGITTGGNNDGILVVQNIFEDLWDEGILVGDDPSGLTRSRNALIQGNIFRKCFKNAVDVNGYDIIIANNQVIECGQDTEGMDIHGLLVYTSRGKMDVDNILVIGNRVKQVGGTGIRVQCIRVDATQTTTTAAVIAGASVVIPVTSVSGFATGDAVSILRGATYEITTLLDVGASTLTADLENGYNEGAVVKLVAEINNVAISHNIVTDVGQITSTSPSIMVDADSTGPALLTDVSVSNNIVETAPRDNILVAGASDVNVVNNFCKNAGRYGIFIYKSKNFLVDDNKVHSSAEHAIRAETSSYGQITKNRITDTNVSHYEIHLTDSDKITISGNIIRGQGQRGILLDPALKYDREAFIVTDNRIDKTTAYGIALAVNDAVTPTTTNAVTAGLNVVIGVTAITGLTAGSIITINDGINSETTTILSVGASAIYADLVNNYNLGATVTRPETAINNSIIATNLIDDCNTGIGILGTADNNVIHGNILLNNTKGIYLASSTANKNKFYGNNFSGNITDMDLNDPFSTSTIAEQGSEVYQTITAVSDTIALQGLYSTIRVTASGGAKTLTSTPTISTTGAVLGQRLMLYGGSGNTVTLQDEAILTGSKLKLRDNTRILGEHTTLPLWYNGEYWVEIKTPVDTFIAITGATPSVSNGTKFVITQTGATVITNFTNGLTGQEIFVVFDDDNSTVDFTSSSLKGNSGADFIAKATDTMCCVKRGAYWYCDVSDNTA